MGLDIRCRCGKISFRAGSYTGFHWWRETLAKHLGFNLKEYWWNNCQPKTLFEPLLNHSDCDGRLTPKECKQMIEPMKKVIRDIEDILQNPWTKILGTYDKDELKYFLEKCKEWLKAFEHSAEKKCPLIFC